MVYYVLGDYDRALADLTMAINLAPHIASAFRQRAVVYAARGDTKSANADSKRASELENMTNPVNRIVDDRVGGVVLELDRYCRNTYAGSAALLVDRNAFGWKCQRMEEGQRRLIHLDTGAACKSQFGPMAIAKYGHFNDPNSWYCAENR